VNARDVQYAQDDQRRRWAVAALAFAVVAPLAYMAQRLLDHAIVGDTDALSMIRQARAAYPWRAAIAAFWGGLAVIVAASPVTASSLRGSHLGRYAMAAAGALGVAVLMLAWLFP